MAGRLELEISATTGREHVPFVRRHLVRAHAMLSPALRELSLALVGEKRMSDLHERFMNLRGPTDVMSFPIDLDGRGGVVSGEVIVCVPVARKRVAEQLKSQRTRARMRGRVGRGTRESRLVSRELLLYSLHGLLHLCGFDDTTDESYRKMHLKEDDILMRLGVGKVFDARAAGSATSGRGATGAT